MKRTLIVLGIISLIMMILWSTPPEMLGKGENKASCTTIFRVIGSDGNPVADCLIHVPPDICGGICVTDKNGECKIDLGSCGTLTATATCCGGSTQFTACAQDLVVIYCPDK